MSYDTASPPSLISQRIGASGGALWFYKSTDAASDVRQSGYISNGDALGMKAGDVVFGVDTDASPIAVQLYIVTSVTAGGAADLSDGTAIDPTDSD